MQVSRGGLGAHQYLKGGTDCGARIASLSANKYLVICHIFPRLVVAVVVVRALVRISTLMQLGCTFFVPNNYCGGVDTQ